MGMGLTERRHRAVVECGPEARLPWVKFRLFNFSLPSVSIICQMRKTKG